MSHNPYTPPTSHVDDPLVASVDPDGNRDVLRATMLIWISFGLGVIGFVMEMFGIVDSQVPVLISLAIGLAIAFLITWWVTAKLKRGRNWMRILITVLMILGVAGPLLFWDFYKTAIVAQYADQPIKGVFDLAQYALSIVAVVLLYTARSRAWFAAMKGTR
jgi:hypothetical protein